MPEIVRALTELFLLVENVAEDWGMAQDHLIDMLTTEGLNTWLEKVGMVELYHVICKMHHIPQGISNVALVSIALDLDNVSSQRFLEAKRNYVPPKNVPNERYVGSHDAHVMHIMIAMMIIDHQMRAKLVVVMMTMMRIVLMTTMTISCTLTLANVTGLFV